MTNRVVVTIFALFFCLALVCSVTGAGLAPSSYTVHGQFAEKVLNSGSSGYNSQVVFAKFLAWIYHPVVVTSTPATTVPTTVATTVIPVTTRPTAVPTTVPTTEAVTTIPTTVPTTATPTPTETVPPTPDPTTIPVTTVVVTPVTTEPTAVPTTVPTTEAVTTIPTTVPTTAAPVQPVLQVQQNTLRLKVFVNPAAYYDGIRDDIPAYVSAAQHYGQNPPDIEYQVVGIENATYSPKPDMVTWDRTVYISTGGGASASDTNVYLPVSALKKSGLYLEHELFHTLGLDDVHFADETQHPFDGYPSLDSVIGMPQWEVLNIMRACNVNLEFQNTVVEQNIARIRAGLPAIWGKSYWSQPGGVLVTIINMPDDEYSVQTLGDDIWYGVYRDETIFSGMSPDNGVLVLSIPEFPKVRSGFAITGEHHTFILLPVTFEASYAMSGKLTDAVAVDADTEEGYNAANYQKTGVPSGLLMPVGFVPPDVLHGKY